MVEDPIPVFVPIPCNNSSYIGLSCDVPNSLCEMRNPCKNGNCTNNKTATNGYACTCPLGFNGTHCELDGRLCTSHICLNNGTHVPYLFLLVCNEDVSLLLIGSCNEASDALPHCVCPPGWNGDHCQSMEHDCDEKKCQNNGVCRPSLYNYTCECLGDSYYGRHCEFTTTRILINQIVAKSFVYVAIIALTIVAVFIVTMDILKYCFGIDVTRKELRQYRREKRVIKRQRRRPVIQKFVYVNASSQFSKRTLKTGVDTTA